MVQKRETKAIHKLCVREILSLSFVCGAYFFKFRGRNLVCFVIAYNFEGKYAPEAGKTSMRTAVFHACRNSHVLVQRKIPCARSGRVEKLRQFFVSLIAFADPF